MQVLVVEDDHGLCEMFRDFLREIGYRPLTAHTAEAALDTLRTERPDVVVLDISLPGMSGLDFLQLQAVRDLRIPTVVISGRATESQAQECLRLGAFDFIGKPVPLERLQEVLACFAPGAATSHPRARPPVDRRRAPRAPVTLPVRVREPNGSEWETTSVDLSTLGIKIRSRGTVAPGRAATLCITLADDEPCLEVASILVRADLDGGAFYFMNLADWQLARVSGLVRRSAAAEPGPAEPHLRILHTIGQAISTSLDVDEVLRIALDALTHVTGHEISSLHLLSADGATLHLRGDRGLRPHLRAINRALPVGQGVIGRVAATGQTVCMPDASEAPDLLPAARAVVKQEGIHAFVCVPIQSRGRILGALSLGRRTYEPFTEAEVALVEASANQIGLALENAQLSSETRRRLKDLEAATTQLIGSDRLSTVGKLMAGLVHDTRNRLTAILGQAELLLMGADDPLKARDRVHIIVKETSRAVEMLRNLLQFSKGDSLERRPCSLEAQVRWVLDLQGPELRRDGIRVATEIESVPAVLADEGQIQQVLFNLVQNAHQAMATHAGERVLTVRLAEVEGRAVLDVLDTGPGIAPDALPRVFDAFFTTKPPGEGTGLGLWVSAAIVERHQGSLRAANRPDRGAVFRVELPAIPPDRTP